MPDDGPPGKIRIPIGPVWNARGPDFSEDMRELCRMVKNRKTPEQLVEHVQNDALINFAFIGNKGMDDQSPFSPVDIEPPPMGKPEFVNLLTRWITEAAMACSTDGTVILADKTTMDVPLAPFGGASVRKPSTRRSTSRRSRDVEVALHRNIDVRGHSADAGLQSEGQR